MAGSKLRGNPIYHDGSQWRYKDTDAPTAERVRPCGYCKKPNRPDDIDACLGELLGVVNACCGHGVSAEAYAQLSDGRRVDGDDAIAFFNGAPQTERRTL